MSEQRPTPEKQPAPDFGEPWHEQEPPHPISVRAGVYWLNPRQFNRAVSCVNACAGMADPAAEIQAMREAIKEAHQALKMIHDVVNEQVADAVVIVPLGYAAAALAKLQPFLP